jgi:hypothetical protein
LAQIVFSITPVLQKAVIFARDIKRPPLGANQSQVLWAWILYAGVLQSQYMEIVTKRAGPLLTLPLIFELLQLSHSPSRFIGTAGSFNVSVSYQIPEQACTDGCLQ